VSKESHFILRLKVWWRSFSRLQTNLRLQDGSPSSLLRELKRGRRYPQSHPSRCCQCSSASAASLHSCSARLSTIGWSPIFFVWALQSVTACKTCATSSPRTCSSPIPESARLCPQRSRSLASDRNLPWARLQSFRSFPSPWQTTSWCSFPRA
jgi:hypothetical protein